MILPIVRREVTGASLSSDLHPVIDRIYRGRNIANMDDLENGLKGLTHFNVLKGMPQAAQILANAVVQNKRIIIVGDFDADGATSTSVCILALRAMGYHNVDFLVPNRFDFGYGLSVPIVDEAEARMEHDTSKHMTAFKEWFLDRLISLNLCSSIYSDLK